jgi:hypothetical protein
MNIFTASLIAALIELVLHWFPWRMAIGRDLPRPVAYVLGVLGFALPLTCLWWMWWVLVIELWIVIAAAGIAVMVAYALDKLIHTMRRGHEAVEQLNEQVKR